MDRAAVENRRRSTICSAATRSPDSAGRVGSRLHRPAPPVDARRRSSSGSRLRRASLLALVPLLAAPALPLRANPAAAPGAPRPAGRAAPGAPASLPSAQAVPPPSAQNDLYVLGPGDELQLSFLDPSAREVGGPLVILPDGTSTLALLGAVQLTGLTLGQASRWLTSLYGRNLIRPQLLLSLTKARPVQVSVLGEVNRPGLYPLSTYSTPVSAIQSAGGVTLNADIRRVVLRRIAGAGNPDRQTVLDLAQLLQVGNQRQNPILFDGDTLIVTRAEKPLPAEVIQIGSSNLSPATINVTVLGEVKMPGTLAVPSNTPLQEALMRAGGPMPWRADRGQIELVRLNRNGTTTSEFYSYQPGKDISQGFNPPLRDRDTVIVRRSNYGKTVDVVNQLVAPLTSVVNTLYLYRNFNNGN